MKETGKKLVLGLFVLILLLSVVLLAVPLFLNPDYLKQVAFDHIQRTFGPYISIGQTNLSLFPHPRVDVTDVVVKKGPDSHAFFRTKFLSVTFKIRPLLRQELVIKELTLVQPELELKRDRQGRWRKFTTMNEESDFSFLGILLLLEKFVVSQGQLTLIDEFPLEGVRGMLLEDLQVSLSTGQWNEPSAELRLKSRVRREGKATILSLEGQIERGLMEPSLPEMRPAESLSLLKFDGEIDVKNFDVRQVVRDFQVDMVPKQMQGLTDIHSQIRLIPGQMGYELVLSDVSVRNPAANFSGSVNVTGLATGDPTLFINFGATPVSVGIIKEVLPLAWLPETVKNSWIQTNVGGTVEVIQATVAGSARSDVGMSLVGEFHLENGFLIGNNLPILENLEGTIVVEPDRVRLVDFVGVYDSIPVHSAQGMVLRKESGPWLELEVQGDVPGDKVMSVLDEIGDPDIGRGLFSSWKILEGTGLLTLRFAGFASNPEEIFFERGEYVARGLEIQVPEFKTPITEGSGRFRFTPTQTDLEGVRGWLGQSQILINGGINTENVPTFDRFHILATLKMKEFLDSWLASVSQAQVIRGPVVLDVTLSGPAKTPRAKGKLDLGDAVLQLGSMLAKAKGVPGTLEFDSHVRRRGFITLDRAELLILPFRMAASGAVEFTPSFGMKARLNTGPIYVGLLPEGLTLGDGVLRSGILEVSFDVTGRGENWRDWQTKGWVALTEGVMDSKGFDFPVENIFLRLKVGLEEAELKRLEFRIQDSQAHINGSIKNWRAQPDINVTIESPQFDVDLLIPKGERSPIRDLLETLAAETTLVGQVTIERPWYKQLALKNLSCMLRIHDGLVTVDRIRAAAEGGEFAGRVITHLPPNKPAAVRASFHAKRFPFKHFNQSIGQEDRLVTGDISVRGKLQGHGRDARGVFPTLNGKMEVMVERGHVRRGTFLPKILAILNLPTILQGEVDFSQDGFPFDKTTATLVVKDGIVTSDDMVVDSPIMKMSLAGNYNLMSDQLDTVSAVSPFGPYSNFMKSIPLFGRILAGDRKGIATALFTIQGSLEDPDVTYMPLESFKTGLTGLAQLAFDVIKNTVMLPSNLLSPDSDGQQSDSGTNELNGSQPLDSERLVPP